MGAFGDQFGWVDVPREWAAFFGMMGCTTTTLGTTRPNRGDRFRPAGPMVSVLVTMDFFTPFDSISRLSDMDERELRFEAGESLIQLVKKGSVEELATVLGKTEVVVRAALGSSVVPRR